MHRYSNLPEEEQNRLRELRQLRILDSPYESLFDVVSRAIMNVCKTPIAIISFVDEDRQWFKSKVGQDGVTLIPRELQFASETILSDETLEVYDATLDERFKDNPLVIGNPHLRFYAGAPITLPLGERIGSLCVIDTIPNQLNEYQKAALEGFAKVISQALLIRDVSSRMTVLNSKEKISQV